jgi:hypothetical protein
MPNDVEPGYTTSLDLWLARGAVVSVIALQLGLINAVWLGAHWLAPTFEIILLIPLIALSARSERLAHRAKHSGEWKRVSRYRPVLTILGTALVIIVSAANAVALFEVVRVLVGGHSASGRTLLVDALNIWATNVIVFALWYWQLDRGGPSLDRTMHHVPSDFLFPQMTAPQESPTASRNPGFVDYLFLSFTTCTAFSPTDTLPLTVRMKLLMMLEALISLLTLALVAARAVNILA